MNCKFRLTRRWEVDVPEEVDGDGCGHESDIYGEADPPGDLLPPFDLQISQDVDADQETRNGTG